MSNFREALFGGNRQILIAPVAMCCIHRYFVTGTLISQPYIYTQPIVFLMAMYGIPR